MPKIIGVTLIVIALGIIYYFFYPRKTSTFQLDLNGLLYNLEIASTPGQQNQGLSNRTSLCSNCGMVFVFPTDTTLPFWMKDTLIPLDMIWINSQGVIVKIVTAQVQNDKSSPPLIYQNDIPAKYVIELNANESQKLNLKTGDIVNIPTL